MVGGFSNLPIVIEKGKYYNSAYTILTNQFPLEKGQVDFIVMVGSFSNLPIIVKKSEIHYNSVSTLLTYQFLLKKRRSRFHSHSRWFLKFTNCHSESQILQQCLYYFDI